MAASNRDDNMEDSNDVFRYGYLSGDRLVIYAFHNPEIIPAWVAQFEAIKRQIKFINEEIHSVEERIPHYQIWIQIVRRFHRTYGTTLVPWDIRVERLPWPGAAQGRAKGAGAAVDRLWAGAGLAGVRAAVAVSRGHGPAPDH